MGFKIQKFNGKTSASQKVESWDTRFGVSNRAVKRNTDGTFVSNISGRQVVKGA